MTISQKTTIHAELGWLRESVAAHIHHTQRGVLRKTLEFRCTPENTDSGGSAMTVWSEKNLTLTAGGIHTLDLESLPCAVFGDYVPLSFSAIGAVFLVNHSATSELILGGGENAWRGFFADAADSLKIPAGGFLCLSAAEALWPVAPQAALLKIRNTGQTEAVYDVAVAGKKYAAGDDDGSSSSAASGSA